MFVTLVWMLERTCYMHMVHGSDESDAVLAARLSDIFIRALGLRVAPPRTGPQVGGAYPYRLARGGKDIS